MSLASQISALATRIGTEFKSVRTALTLKADDNAVVHIAGTENITGSKIFQVVASSPNGPTAGQHLANKSYVDTTAQAPHPGAQTPITSNATPTIYIDFYEFVSITALTVPITGITISGTPVDWQPLTFRIKSATAQGIALGTSFANGAVSIPTTTTAGKTITISFRYDIVVGKFMCMAVDTIGY